MHTTETPKENPIAKICGLFTDLARIYTDGKDRREHGLGRFSLANLIGSLSAFLSRPDFFSQKRLARYENQFESFSEDLPAQIEEGTIVTMAVLPCTHFGHLLDPAKFDMEKHPESPYLQVFYTLPGDKLSVPHNKGPFLAYTDLLPEEVVRECSFTVKYPASQAGQSDEEIATQNCQYLVSNLKQLLEITQKLLTNQEK